MVPRTFLETVIARYWGRPAYRQSDGRAYWNCQFHDDSHPSFSTLPPKEKHKDRALCFGCGWRGDVYDFLKEMHPTETWPERRMRADHYRIEFEGGGGRSAVLSPTTAATDSEAREKTEFLPPGERPPQKTALAYCNVLDYLALEKISEELALAILQRVAGICDQCDTTVYHLLDRWPGLAAVNMNSDFYWNTLPGVSRREDCDE